MLYILFIICLPIVLIRNNYSVSLGPFAAGGILLGSSFLAVGEDGNHGSPMTIDLGTSRCGIAFDGYTGDSSTVYLDGHNRNGLCRTQTSRPFASGMLEACSCSLWSKGAGAKKQSSRFQVSVLFEREAPARNEWPMQQELQLNLPLKFGEQPNRLEGFSSCPIFLSCCCYSNWFLFASYCLRVEMAQWFLPALESPFLDSGPWYHTMSQIQHCWLLVESQG